MPETAATRAVAAEVDAIGSKWIVAATRVNPQEPRPPNTSSQRASRSPLTNKTMDSTPAVATTSDDPIGELVLMPTKVAHDQAAPGPMRTAAAAAAQRLRMATAR